MAAIDLEWKPPPALGMKRPIPPTGMPLALKIVTSDYPMAGYYDGNDWWIYGTGDPVWVVAWAELPVIFHYLPKKQISIDDLYPPRRSQNVDSE